MTSAAPAKRRAQALKPGMTVADRYVVRGVLGEGGMGQVLDVEHVALGRHFALKVLRLERWNDELVRRFNREARALGSLTTPRVAQVTDFGIDSQAGPFYVMELLEGETLEDRLEREEKLPVHEALELCASLCEALDDVHAAGIVHRDLKPSNVGLPSSGPVTVKLLDFGLAASVDDAFLSRITESKQILGSLPYMAPEQFNAAEPAITMDIYATGIVLFECLTGRMPFIAPSTAAMIHQILSMPVPALPADVAGTPFLQALLERLLAKEPEARFVHAKAAAQAIREVIIERPAAPMTRLGIEEVERGQVPITGAARAHVGNMPTLLAESGTRLSGAPSAAPAATPSAAPAATPPLRPTQAMTGQPPAGSYSASHGHPSGVPQAPYPLSQPSLGPGPMLGGSLPPTTGTQAHRVSASTAWIVRIGLATLVGLVFAGLTAVAVALGLSLLDGDIDRPGPARPTRVAAPSTPTAESSEVPVVIAPQTADPQTADPQVADPQTADPQTTDQVADPQFVGETPEARPVRPVRPQPSPGRERLERNPLPSVRFRPPPSRPPPSRPPPSRPPPRTGDPRVIRNF